jgi:hypothetical protein
MQWWLALVEISHLRIVAMAEESSGFRQVWR